GVDVPAKLREIPVPAVQRILLSVVEGHRRVEAVPGQVAPAEQGIGAPTAAAGVLGEVGVSGGLSPLVVLAQDEVDDAADRIAAVDGGRAVLQHRSEEHTSELQSLRHLVCRLLLEKKKKQKKESLLN